VTTKYLQSEGKQEVMMCCLTLLESHGIRQHSFVGFCKPRANTDHVS